MVKEQIARFLAGKPPQTAITIAKALKLTKAEVNRALYHDQAFRKYEGPGAAPGWGLISAPPPAEDALGGEFVAPAVSKEGGTQVQLMAGVRNVAELLKKINAGDFCVGDLAYVNAGGALPDAVDFLSSSRVQTLWRKIDEGEDDSLEQLCVLAPLAPGSIAGFCQLPSTSEVELALHWAAKKGVAVVAVCP